MPLIGHCRKCSLNFLFSVERYQRGGVDIAPVQIAGTIEEIHLIPEVAVAAGRKNVYQQLQPGDQRQETPVQGREITTSLDHGRGDCIPPDGETFPILQR